jgi:dolichyl-phosphate-mannose--protein O-mannosyl transferase
MNFSISVGFITGIMLGFEHAHVDDIHYILIDVLFVRFIIEIE